MNNQELYEQRMKEILMAQEQLKTQGYAQAVSQQGNPQDVNLMKQQLSMGEELETLDYLLQSYSLVYNPQTKKKEWVKPDVDKDILNEDQIILSDYGIHYFREKIAGYINKNTLLSNYDEETILNKMYDITTTINDDIFLLYEKMFLIPSIERCKRELELEISNRLEIREIAYTTLGFTYDKEKEKEAVLRSMEYQLEEKIFKIRQRLFKAKLKRFNSLLRLIQDTIHSSYNRALGGQERRGLNSHMTITEANGGFNMPVQEKKSILSKIGLGGNR